MHYFSPFRGALVVAALFPAAATFAQSSSSATPSSVPSAGNDVKGGDVIIWGVNKLITLSPSDKSSSVVTAGTSSTAPTAADDVQAALALATAAHKLVGPLPPPPEGASAIEMKYTGAYDAAEEADQNVQKAKAAAFDAHNSTATVLGTTAAARALVDSAALATKAAEAESEERSASLQKARAAAANGAAKPADKQKLEIAVVDAEKADTKASGDLATANAYYLAALAAFESLAVTPPPSTNTVCFPTRSRFNVTSVVAATKPTNTTPSATVSNTQLVSGHFSSRGAYSILHWRHYRAIPGRVPDPNAAPLMSGNTPCGQGAPANYDVTYDFTADQLAKTDFYRQGFTWGGLVVPYKYYFTDHSIKSNTSVLAYVGYEGWFSGISLATIFGVGAGSTPTTITTSQVVDGKSTTTTSTASLVTASIGAGWVATFGGVFKAGLMFGRDFQGNASAFPYEHKLWMGLSIGAGF